MNDYEQRIKVLEEKVKILEETLETLKNMQMSEQMQGYIKAKTRTLKMAELINSISDKPELDLSKEENAVKQIQEKKKSVDEQITEAMNHASTVTVMDETSPEFFNYEIENAITVSGYTRYEVIALKPYVGNGIRITSYNGFGSNDVIIPKYIDGLPVVSIGEKAFMNATFSNIIIPNTVVAILESAFEGCTNISHIDLPENLRFIGNSCFNKSGLTDIIFPDNLVEISKDCCFYCKNLKSAIIGSNVKNINFFAFCGTSVTKIVIPDNVDSINYNAFGSDIDKCDVECAVLGKNTTVKEESYSREKLNNVKCIYCLPGSEIQKYAREHNIPMKPLSEFKPEE